MRIAQDEQETALHGVHARVYLAFYTELWNIFADIIIRAKSLACRALTTPQLESRMSAILHRITHIVEQSVKITSHDCTSRVVLWNLTMQSPHSMLILGIS